ncbi:MAG: ATP-binding protein [Acidobacteria bacterium]|nr:ATP-binding protein [Acidobacteriota bacterium]
MAFTGPSGVGKSTFVQHLIRQLDPKHYQPVFLAYAGLKRSGIHRALADLLGVDAAGRQVPLLVKLQKFIQQHGPQSHQPFPVLIIDDAHMMERETLLDCCSLLSMPLQGTSAASLILIGDHQLTKTLQLHIMTPIRSRITAIIIHLD